MAKKQISTQVPQEVYDEIKRRADAEGVSVLAWTAKVVEKEISGEKPSAPILTTAEYTVPHNPVWSTIHG